MIFDDERLTTDTLVTMFSQSGYEFKGVYSAKQAVLTIVDWHPALVIIDVLLPAMNDIDLILNRSQWLDCDLFLFSDQTYTSDLLDDCIPVSQMFGD